MSGYVVMKKMDGRWQPWHAYSHRTKKEAIAFAESWKMSEFKIGRIVVETRGVKRK